MAPIKSTVRFPLNPVHLLLEANRKTGLDVTSVSLLNQIRAVDRMRLIRRLGVVDELALEPVDEAIKISLGLLRRYKAERETGTGCTNRSAENLAFCSPDIRNSLGRVFHLYR